jgi:hypothetical protein
MDAPFAKCKHYLHFSALFLRIMKPSSNQVIIGLTAGGKESKDAK